MSNKENIENIKILIIGINFILAIAFFFSLFLISYNIKNNQAKEFISSFQSIIPIAAAWLVLCIANRQVKIDEAKIIHAYKIELIQSTHYLIAIITDLKSKTNHFKYMIENKNYNFNSRAVESLAKSISDRYEQIIQERDSYKFVGGSTIKKIINLSGSIFGSTHLIYAISVGLTQSLWKQTDCAAPVANN